MLYQRLIGIALAAVGIVEIAFIQAGYQECQCAGYHIDCSCDYPLVLKVILYAGIVKVIIGAGILGFSFWKKRK
ncbi:MAG: hypothetical protein E6K88_07675 [Thaumarchaeota archaeon]|nr:MAG: hypothetical protein E6K88_07675 [Nitrososphaerota archaeon]